MKIFSSLIFCLLFLALFQETLFSQSALRAGIKFGGEFKDYLSGKNGSFANNPDYEFGLFTGIKLSSNDQHAIFLKIELNYVKLVGYRIGRVYQLTSWNNGGYSTINIIEDEKFTFPFVELGIIPEYFFFLNNGNMISLFLGPSLGIGTRSVTVNEITHGWTYDYFDEYGMGFESPVSLNAGVNFYYKILFVGIKYRSTSFRDSNISSLRKISLLAGLAFQ